MAEELIDSSLRIEIPYAHDRIVGARDHLLAI